MVQVSNQRRGLWMGLALLAALLIGVLALALTQPAAGLLALLLAALSLMLFISGRATRASDVYVVRPRPSTTPNLRPMAQRIVQSANGDIRQALVVPVKTDEPYQVVLTVDGYALVKDDGQVVYTLKHL